MIHATNKAHMPERTNTGHLSKVTHVTGVAGIATGTKQHTYMTRVLGNMHATHVTGDPHHMDCGPALVAEPGIPGNPVGRPGPARRPQSSGKAQTWDKQVAQRPQGECQ